VEIFPSKIDLIRLKSIFKLGQHIPKLFPLPQQHPPNNRENIFSGQNRFEPVMANQIKYCPEKVFIRPKNYIEVNIRMDCS